MFVWAGKEEKEEERSAAGVLGGARAILGWWEGLCGFRTGVCGWVKGDGGGARKLQTSLYLLHRANCTYQTNLRRNNNE